MNHKYEQDRHTREGNTIYRIHRNTIGIGCNVVKLI